MHSYATTGTSPTDRARTLDQQPSLSELATLRANFVAFTKMKLGMALDQFNITAIHDLQPRCDSKRSTIVQLFSVDKKAEIMMKWQALRGTDVYMNDHLSYLNTELFKEVRQMKCGRKIMSTWTQNSCVFMKVQECRNKVRIKTCADLARM